MYSMDESKRLEIRFDRFHKCIETWIPEESRGYRLYLIENFGNSPSDDYALTSYKYGDENREILAIGSTNLRIESPSREAVNNSAEKLGLTPFTKGQWNTVLHSYERLSRLVLRECIFDGVPQLYKGAVYYEIDDFQSAMEQYLDETQKNIEQYNSNIDSENNYYEEYADFSRIGDDQYHNIQEILEGAIEWENEDVVPYAQHCQLAALLEFEMYEAWQLRALEYLHNSVLVNKPELAKTKALMEKGLTQKEISEVLGKSQSTVSLQVSQISDLEQRAEWMLQQKS